MKTMAFVDAGQFRPAVINGRLNLLDTQRFDWSLFKAFLEREAKGPLLDIHYFDSLESDMINRQANFHQFLRSELTFCLHFSPLKSKRRSCPSCQSSYHEFEQKGVDVSMTISMLTLAHSHAYDQALLCTGDGDFAPLVRYIRDFLGKRIVVFGWSNGVAPILRELAYKTVTLNDHTEAFIGDKT